MSYLYIISFALTLFFSFSLIVKRDKTLSEKIFTAWIILLGITELSFFLNAIGQFSDYLLLFSIICDSHVLHGSFFYLYIVSFLNNSFRLKWGQLIHLLPFFFLLGLKLYFNNVAGVMDCYGTGCLHHSNRYVDLLSFLKFAILGSYLFMGWHKVHDFKEHSGKTGGINQVKINWAFNVTIGAILLFSFSVGYKILYRLGFGFLGSDTEVINIIVSFFILIFLYMGNTYAYLFVSPIEGRSVSLDNSPSPTNKSRSEEKLPEEPQIENIDKKFSTIEKFIHQKKPYLQGQYTLRALSENTGIPQNEISRIIQIKTGRYYCEYMNAFRVKTLKEKLDDPGNDMITVFYLALECGFSSKTSYNRIFKNHTGVTPSEYRSSKNRNNSVD